MGNTLDLFDLYLKHNKEKLQDEKYREILSTISNSAIVLSTLLELRFLVSIKGIVGFNGSIHPCSSLTNARRDELLDVANENRLRASVIKDEAGLCKTDLDRWKIICDEVTRFKDTKQQIYDEAKANEIEVDVGVLTSTLKEQILARFWKTLNSYYHLITNTYQFSSLLELGNFIEFDNLYISYRASSELRTVASLTLHSSMSFKCIEYCPTLLEVYKIVKLVRKKKKEHLVVKKHYKNLKEKCGDMEDLKGLKETAKSLEIEIEDGMKEESSLMAPYASRSVVPLFNKFDLVGLLVLASRGFFKGTALSCFEVDQKQIGELWSYGVPLRKEEKGSDVYHHLDKVKELECRKLAYEIDRKKESMKSKSECQLLKEFEVASQNFRRTMLEMEKRPPKIVSLATLELVLHARRLGANFDRCLLMDDSISLDLKISTIEECEANGIPLRIALSKSDPEKSEGNRTGGRIPEGSGTGGREPDYEELKSEGQGQGHRPLFDHWTTNKDS